MALYIGLGVVLVLAFWVICVSNSLNRAIVKIREADSGIDVALVKRYDILMKMIDTVKGYAKHEKETLFEVINLRNGMKTVEKMDENQKMDNNLKKIQAIVETYPELKASENYMVLQKSILDVEEHLQAARRIYNSNVSLYNQAIVTFPKSVIASIKGLKTEQFFEAEVYKKEDVKIEL